MTPQEMLLKAKEGNVKDADDIAEILKTVLQQIYENTDVEITIMDMNQTQKNSSNKAIVMTPEEPEGKLVPLFYAEEMYSAYKNGMDIEEILKEMISAYEKSAANDRNNVTNISETLLDFNKAKQGIHHRLVNKNAKKEMLQEIPHRIWNDLAIMYYCEINKNGQQYEAVISHELMNQWNITENELFEIAETNAKQIPSFLIPTSVYNGGTSTEKCAELTNKNNNNVVMVSPQAEIYIATNQFDDEGAIVVLQNNYSILEPIAGILHTDLYIVPQSTDSMLVVPMSMWEETEDVIIKEIKKRHKASNESIRNAGLSHKVLSENIYKYDRITKSMTIV